VRYVWGLNSQGVFGSFRDSQSSPNNNCQYIYGRPVVENRYVSFDGTNEALEQDFTYATTWNGAAWTTKQSTITTHDLLRAGQPSFETYYSYSSVTVPTPRMTAARQPPRWPWSRRWLTKTRTALLCVL